MWVLPYVILIVVAVVALLALPLLRGSTLGSRSNGRNGDTWPEPEVLEATDEEGRRD